ncbi:MAG: hypothetical protein WC476_01680 [Phycisphaerae bacterium]
MNQRDAYKVAELARENNIEAHAKYSDPITKAKEWCVCFPGKAAEYWFVDYAGAMRKLSEINSRKGEGEGK